MRPTRLLLTSAVVLVIAGLVASPADAEWDLSWPTLRPGIAGGQEEKELGLSLGYEISEGYARLISDPGSFQWSVRARFESSGSYVWAEGLNPAPWSTVLAFDAALNMFRPAVNPDFVPGELPDESRRVPAENHGRLRLGLQVGHETDQSFEVHQVIGGLVAGYANIRTVGWAGLLPTVLLFGDGVLMVSRVRDDEVLAGADETYARARLEASLKHHFGEYLPTSSLKPLALYLDFRYSREFSRGEAWEETDRHKALYVAGGIGYAFQEPVFWCLRGVAAGVSYGRIPPVEKDSTVALVYVDLGAP